MWKNRLKFGTENQTHHWLRLYEHHQILAKVPKLDRNVNVEGNVLSSTEEINNWIWF